VELGAEPSSGRGRIHSFTVNYQTWNPLVEVPYVIALVELDDQAGLRLTTNLVDHSIDEVAIGRDVEVVFEDHGDVQVPVFRMASRQ
jgi:uncharacterized OB-fold protein